MKQNQAQIFLVEDLQKAKRERDGQIDDLLCSLEGIRQGLDATVEGITPELARVFLVSQLGNHLAALRDIVLPEA